MLYHSKWSTDFVRDMIGKPPTIVAVFNNRKDKDRVLSAAPTRLHSKPSYHVNEQFPNEITERRKALYPNMKEDISRVADHVIRDGILHGKMASKTAPSTGIIRTMVHVLCEVCGKSYRSRSGLNDHKRVHQNNAPYKCCAKLFFSKANYQRHRCNKHKDEKRHKCETCLKTFATETDLSQHIKKIHKEHKYKCDICGLSTSTKGSLLDHMNKHTGRKPHKCKKCGKCYRYQSGLSRHCKQH